MNRIKRKDLDMKHKSNCVAFLSLILLLANVTYAQDTTEERLDRIEAKLDTLLSYHQGITSASEPGTILRDDSNLRWGIAGHSGSVLDKGYFVINHNNGWKIPYWVAYYLSESNLQGGQSRTNDFRADPQLSIGQRSELADYRNSGYDRGHNAPAAAFKRNREAMSTTFLLSNMTPQSPSLNRRIWKNLESEVRDLVGAHGEAWVVTGNLFLSSDSTFVAPTDFIGNGNVAVPTHCFKAILSTRDDGSFDMFAFLLPNLRDQIPGIPSDYVISVDRLEEISGYDFFPDLPDDIENALERQIADVWPL